MIVRRNLATVLVRVARQYPVVTVTGPRQSGKTTLCRQVFRRKPYVNLERIDERAFASSDPRGFLADHPNGAILDEVQHAPDLLSYLQAEVDDDPRPGRWILTGSEHFGLSGSVAQTLAGRTGILHLLPLAIDELRRFPKPPTDLFSTLVAGGFPRTHDRHIPSDLWRLLAGRTAQAGLGLHRLGNHGRLEERAGRRRTALARRPSSARASSWPCMALLGRPRARSVQGWG
jgi:predicted AAA+ superfamily ATPase